MKRKLTRFHSINRIADINMNSMTVVSFTCPMDNSIVQVATMHYCCLMQISLYYLLALTCKDRGHTIFASYFTRQI